jgi:hypothetical protein
MHPKFNRILLSSLLIFCGAGRIISLQPMSDPNLDEISKHPLSDPNTDGIDRSLIGSWVALRTDKDGKTNELVLRFSMPPSGMDYPKGILICFDGAGPPDPSIVVPTTVGNERYISWGFPEQGWIPKAGWNKARIKGYFFARYRLKDNKLLMSYRADNGFKNAVVSGDLRGTVVDAGGEKKVTVTESTNGLRKYVKNNDSWLFTDEEEFTKR